MPYTVGTTTPPSASSGAQAVPSAAPSGILEATTFPRVLATAAPPSATSWNLGGLPMIAPPGRVFIAAVPLSDTTPKTVVAFVGDGGSMAGDLVLYREGSSTVASTLTRMPSWLPSGPGCGQSVALSQVGKSMLWLDVAVTCEHDSNAANRWMAAISTTQSPPQRLELKALPLAKGERLITEAESTDRDNDGEGDLTVAIGLEGAIGTKTGPRVSLPLRFFERPTGLARDTEEPGASLRGSAIHFASLAPKKPTAEMAIDGSTSLRRLISLVCGEGNTPLVTNADGAAIACGDTRAIDEARFAEGRAAVSAGDLPRAFALVARLIDDHPGAKRTQELDKALVAAAPLAKVTARPLKTEPSKWSVALPIAFEASGKLLVRTDDGVVRVDPTSLEETPAKDVTTWNTNAELVGDLRLDRVLDTCLTKPLELHFLGSSGAGRALPLPFDGGTHPRCSTQKPLFVSLLDRDSDGLVAMAQGQVFHVAPDGDSATSVKLPDNAGSHGTARSPNGLTIAVRAAERVLLFNPNGTSHIWKPNPFFTLNACTVADDAKAAACMLDSGIVLLTP